MPLKVVLSATFCVCFSEDILLFFAFLYRGPMDIGGWFLSTEYLDCFSRCPIDPVNDTALDLRPLNAK